MVKEIEGVITRRELMRKFHLRQDEIDKLRELKILHHVMKGEGNISGYLRADVPTVKEVLRIKEEENIRLAEAIQELRRKQQE